MNVIHHKLSFSRIKQGWGVCSTPFSCHFSLAASACAVNGQGLVPSPRMSVAEEDGLNMGNTWTRDKNKAGREWTKVASKTDRGNSKEYVPSQKTTAAVELALRG